MTQDEVPFKLDAPTWMATCCDYCLVNIATVHHGLTHPDLKDPITYSLCERCEDSWQTTRRHQSAFGEVTTFAIRQGRANYSRAKAVKR